MLAPLYGAIAAAAVVAGCASSHDPSTAPSDAGPAAALPVDGDAETSGSGVIRALDRVRIGSENGTGYTNVGHVSAPIDWMQGPFANVTLIVDLESTCYPFESWDKNPPPTGQNWPADCDAFDRNFDVYVEQDPGLEAANVRFDVIHAITPFGGPEHLEADVTDLANALPGPHALRAELVSYSDEAGMVTGSNAGWTVSARLEVVPGSPPRNVLAAVPLFSDTITATHAPADIPWEVPADASGGRIEYRASGHGQGTGDDGHCEGPAEEFCDRHHFIFVDGVMVSDLEPWRADCARLCTLVNNGGRNGFNYCKENPCGAVESVRASRANWCPGTMTPPIVLEGLPALSMLGAHSLSVQIPEIAEGGQWAASATYYAYGGR